jgi:DNA-binding GntR family transcriptional regulator
LPQFRTLQEFAAAQLREWILSGELEPGARIDQEALAQELGMSRMPIREALRELAVTGLVTAVPHRGVIVSRLTAEEVDETYEIRGLLEGRAAGFAVPNLSQTDLDEMSARIARMAEAEDVSEWVRANAEFHTIVEQRSNRARLLQLIGQLRNQCEPYVRIYLKYLEHKEHAEQEHRAILEACLDRSPERAEECTRVHLVNTGKDVVAWLLEQQAATGSTSATSAGRG